MFKIVLSVFSLVLSIFCFASGDSAQWSNTLKPAGMPGPTLRLAVNGKSHYVIVISRKATTQDQKAANDLQHWLEEISDVKLPIRYDSIKLPWGSHKINIGYTNDYGNLRNPFVKVKLNDEGYGICCQGKDLYLWGGRSRGVINAVYALLEEDLGCRWYSNEDSHTPRLNTLAFQPVPRTYLPKLSLRDPFYYCSFNADWSLRNRTNAPYAEVPEEWGGRIDHGKDNLMFVHTFNTLVPPEKYFTTHPEYYMLSVEGKRKTQQLCTTDSNVVRIVTNYVLDFLKENPATEVISVSKNDGGETCLCPRCKAIDDAEGTNMGALLYLVNKVAEAIEKPYPNVSISTLAYLETIGIPETIRPRKNVIIQLCNDVVGSWTYPFSPARETEFGKTVEQWSAAHNRIYIWDYVVNFSHYLAPMPNMDAVADNIRFYVDHHTEGIMTQGDYQSPGAERDWQRSWIIAKLMWDPTRNIDSLTRDFIFGHYGKAAIYVWQYERLLNQQKEKFRDQLKKPAGGIRYGMDHPFLTLKFLQEATAIFVKAKAVSESDSITRRIELAYLPVLYVKLSRDPSFTGEEYETNLEQFEAIVTRERITHLKEGGPDVKQFIDQCRKTWSGYKERSQSAPPDSI